MRSASAGFAAAFTSVILGATAALTVTACGTITPSTGAPHGPGASRTAAPPGTPGPTSTPTPTASTAPHAGTWHLLPPAPRTAPLILPVSVWTGREVLIYGIATSRNPDSNRGITLAYSPASGQWRRLAPGPAPHMAQNGQAAVWTGTEMLVFGLTNAAYNPATNTWRPIARYAGPVSAVGAVAVWTGHQVIVWGGGCCGGATSAGGVYTPAANTWQPLPLSPLSARHTSGVWTGTEVIIAGGSHPTYSGSGPAVLADAAAYNPATRTWRTLPPMPQPRYGATAVWDGTEALFIGGTLTNGRAPTASGVAVNPATGQWRRLPRMEFGRTGYAAVWTGHQVLVWGGLTGRYPSQAVPPHGVAYDPVANRWSALPQAPLRGRAGPLAVWTGRQMIVWGGTFEGKLTSTFAHDGAAYQPRAG